jgi:hypothetical protein
MVPSNPIVRDSDIIADALARTFAPFTLTFDAPFPAPLTAPLAGTPAGTPAVTAAMTAAPFLIEFSQTLTLFYGSTEARDVRVILLRYARDGTVVLI